MRVAIVFAVILSGALWTMPAAFGQTLGTCYVPSTGTMYVSGAPDTPASCRAGHPTFKFLSDPTYRDLNLFSPLLHVRNTGPSPSVELEADGSGHALKLVGSAATQYSVLHTETSSDATAGYFEAKSDAHAVLGSSTGSRHTIMSLNSGGGDAIHANSSGSGSGIFIYKTGSGNALMVSQQVPGIAADIYNEASGLALRVGGPSQFNGSVTVNGNHQVYGSKNAVVPTSSGKRLMYSEEATEVWFTDYGFAKLENGEAWVAIDEVYAETANVDEPYHVFLQPLGTNELHLIERSPKGFRVRLSKGNADAEFSYRIVAKRKNYEGHRLRLVE